jgi:DNA-binding MarR family transcriptional regulator
MSDAEYTTLLAKNPGYVPLRRGIVEHLHGMTGNEAKVYMALLCMADFKTGALSITMRDLADILGIDVASVHRSMKALTEPHNDSGTRYISYTPARNQHIATRVRILKYLKSVAVAPAQQRNNSATTAQQQHTPSDLRKGASKNLRTKEKTFASEDEFEKFWSAYPRKVDKGRARKDFEKALKLTDIGTILAGVERYKKSDTVARGFVKYPATWLNAEGWSDEYEPEQKEVEW